MHNILVINPGSTSTKIALFADNQKLWQEDLTHTEEDLRECPTIFSQLPMRLRAVEAVLAQHDLSLDSLSCIAARGGLIPSVPAGAFEVTPAMLETLEHHPVNHHASNLGAAIAYALAQRVGIKAYIYDPVTVDEMIDLVRITGQKEIRRFGQGHNLNMRSAALHYCQSTGTVYQEACLIVAHLGGGITLSLHKNGRIIDMVSDDEGAFSPERSGELPCYLLLKMIDREHLDYTSAMKKLQRQGGLKSLLGTTDAREVERRIAAGDKDAELVYEAMALSVAKSIAKLAVVVNGSVDQIILTGGLAYSRLFTDMISARVRFISPVCIFPGENEMQALAEGALRVLLKQEQAQVYRYTDRES